MAKKKVNFEKIKEEIKKLISEITEIPIDELKDGADFTKDLGIDSMMALEMVAAIEKKYKIVVPEEDIPNIRNLKSIYEILEKKLKK